MEVFGKAVPSKEVVLRVLGNLFAPEKEKKPLVAVFYVNDNCNGRCKFCSQKDHVEGAKAAGQTDLATQKKILTSIRADVPNVYLMGGEPSIHPNLKELLAECVRLDFDTIGINTNAVKYRPEILEHANLLVLSLFSTDPLVVGSKLFPDVNAGQQTKLGQRVIDNIKRYAKERDPEKTVAVVNKVVTGEEGDIKGVFDLMKFCREHGLKLNIAPAIMPDNRPDPRLVDNPAWAFLIDYLLKNMDLVVCSAAYLKTIRKFENFYCTPNAVPAIRQNGDIDVPCPNVGSPKVVNLLEAGGVFKALQKGREEFGDFDPRKDCHEQCHKACYVESANLANEGFVVDAMRKLFGKRVNGVVEGKGYSYVDLLMEFCLEDIQDYDFIVDVGPIKRKEKIFEALMQELSKEELEQLRDRFAEIVDFYDARWRFSTSAQKAVRVALDMNTHFYTNPFTSVFRMVQKVIKQQVISDYSGGRTIYRADQYRRIIEWQLFERAQKNAA